MLEPVPPVIPLLTMIRLSEGVVTEVQKRRCPPAEHFIFSVRIQLWPVFQKAMSENVDALKKLAEGSSTGYFSRATVTTDAMVATASTLSTSAEKPTHGFVQICKKYVVLFNALVSLTVNEEETMIFSK